MCDRLAVLSSVVAVSKITCLDAGESPPVEGSRCVSQPATAGEGGPALESSVNYSVIL